MTGRTPTPVVLVHGTRTSAAIWDRQVRTLTRAGHPCTAPDLPGHGVRSGEVFTTRGAFEVIDRAVAGAPGPPLLVGLSLGGYLSLAYSARSSRAVAGLVLSGCSTEIRGMPLLAYRRVSTALARLTGRAHRWQVVADMLEQMHGYSSIGDLRRATVPVWTVDGRRDPLRLGARRLRAAGPGPRRVVVPRAGHDVNTEAPVAFDRALLTVLARLDDGSAGTGGAVPSL
ncbi:alpha/beta fold hydrolase [Cellulomonas bogoriensis]|uniref:Alpha/beta hydrolase n=1 Tax=Cellulomonas bogoriensis 69B4 = DSM 16987 TaxID=1386082 RepID=A0A0A0C010_9CELL|nr:alpha/beta hydrolase [Cellulomonas bogoriensis]KGM13242.1 alpha/beta hydrolase [Cellulomonas bogoriensis 69B4 = DSM 16987]